MHLHTLGFWSVVCGRRKPHEEAANKLKAGEILLLAEKHYPYFGFAGGSVFHHAPADMPERTTGPELLEPVGRALVKALTTIENSMGG